MRLIAGLLFVLLAMFCGFGFLASFEYPGITSWKVGYATAGALCLLAAYRTLWTTSKKND